MSLLYYMPHIAPFFLAIHIRKNSILRHFVLSWETALGKPVKKAR